MWYKHRMSAQPHGDPYNFSVYTPEVSKAEREAFRSRPRLRVGEVAPSFRLPRIDGGHCDLEEIRAEGHVALVFGCLSAPPCLTEMPVIDDLARQVAGEGVRFLFVYTREHHPGELLPPHRSLGQKLDHARAFADRVAPSFPVCVDDLAGSTHRAYGGLPFMSAVVHRDGTLVHRGEWAQASALWGFLANLRDRDAAQVAGRTGRLCFTESLRFDEREDRETRAAYLALAGDQALEDVERGHVPPETG